MDYSIWTIGARRYDFALIVCFHSRFNILCNAGVCSRVGLIQKDVEIVHMSEHGWRIRHLVIQDDGISPYDI